MPRSSSFSASCHRLRSGLPASPRRRDCGRARHPAIDRDRTILRLVRGAGVGWKSRSRKHGRIVLPSSIAPSSRCRNRRSAQAERPALRPEPGGPTINVLLTHGVYGGLGEERGPWSTAAPSSSRELLARRNGNTSRLATTIAPSRSPPILVFRQSRILAAQSWGQLQEKARRRIKSAWQRLSARRASRRSRRVPSILRRCGATSISRRSAAPGSMPKSWTRRSPSVWRAPRSTIRSCGCFVWDVDRAVFAPRDLDHAAIRGFKARALNFQARSPAGPSQRNINVGRFLAPNARRLTETVRDFLGRRPLDAGCNRETFVTLGVDYLESRRWCRGRTVKAAAATASSTSATRRYRDRVRRTASRHLSAQRLAKTSLLEASPGDLRQSGGAQATRTRSGICAPRRVAPVRVELEFGLGSHGVSRRIAA